MKRTKQLSKALVLVWLGLALVAFSCGNDDDSGTGQQCYIKFTDGIAGKKNPYLFKDLVFLSN